MRIRGWSIDGFGVFRGAEVCDLGDGLTVFHGPNEAGKSTLLAFLRGVLFGFPDGRSKDPRHPPLRGGRHGGRVRIEGAGGVLVVDREASRRAEPTITRPDGGEGDAGDLQALTGGADARLFRTVFCFSLAELQSFETLNAEGIRDRIFSAGIAGAGRSAREALAALQEQAAGLYGPRRRKSRLQLLRAELRAVEEATRAAQRQAEGHADLVARERALEARAEALRAEAAGARRRSTRLQLLIDLWPVWHRLEDAHEALRGLAADAALPLAPTSNGGDGGRSGAGAGDEPSPAASPGDAELVARFASLAEDLGRHRERLDALPGLGARREQAEQAIAQRLRALGPGWDAARLAAFDGSIPRREEVRRWERRLDEAGTAAVAAALERDTRRTRRTEDARDRETLAASRAAMLSEPGGAPLPDLDTLDARLRAGGRLGAERQELHERQTRAEARASAMRDLERSLRVSRDQHPWLPPAPLRLALWVAAGLLAVRAMAGAAVTAGIAGISPATAAVAGATTALLALLLHAYTAHARRLGARRTTAERDAQAEIDTLAESLADDERRIAELEASIAAGAADVGLTPPLSAALLEDARAALTQLRERRQALEGLEQQLARFDRQLEADDAALAELEAVAAARERALAELERDWRAWLEAAGMPGDLTTAGAIDFFDAIRGGLGELATLQALGRSLEQQRAAGDAWETGARRLLAEAGDAPGAQAGGAPLAERFAACRQQLEQRQRLGETARGLTQQLDERLGTGPEADALRGELASGRLDDWQRENEALAARLAENEEELEHTKQQLYDTRRARREVEESADVAALELERAARVEEITEVARRWRIIRLAAGLIEETLDLFERTRQPAVLQQATRLFAEVTGGRYTQVAPGAGGKGIVVVERDQRRKDTGALSRGTAEQLYICLRLGLAAEFARRSTELPLIMDDVLVDFDPERARAMAGVLARFARTHQVLLFTCHPTTRDLLLAAAPEARAREIEPQPGGNGGSKRR